MLDPVKDIFTVTGLRALITKIVGGLATKVAKTDVVSSWQSTPDDAHVPTEKLVKDTLDNLPPGTAVKGDAESEYRTGNVNLTPANIGAYSKTESDSRYKAVQNPVSDPAASGSGLSFIDSVSQDANGVITPHKKTVQDGTTAQKGVVQLNNAINSTSTTEAATPKAVKDAYDALNNKIVARATFLSQAEWAVQSQLPGDPAKVYYVEDGTGEDAYTVYVWKESTSEYVEVDESSIDLDGYWHDGPATTGDGNVVTDVTLGNDGIPVLVKGITAASLDSNGDVPLEQIPDSVKDKIVYIDGMATLNLSTGAFVLTVPDTTFTSISTVVNNAGKLPVLRVTVNDGRSYLKLYYKGLMSNSLRQWHSFGSTDNLGGNPCTTDAKVFDNDAWEMTENIALNSKGNGSDVSVIPDGTSTGTDIGSSTKLEVWAQKFKNLVGSLTNYVQKSQTSGLLKNDGLVDTSDYLTKTGDASNTTSTFTKASGDTSSMTSGGKLSVIFTAISSFFASFKALAFKDNVDTSDIANDAITAAKVKDNETLPVNVSGSAGYLQYNGNEINFKNVPTAGNKNRNWFNFSNGDDATDTTNTIRSYWFGDRSNSVFGSSNTILMSGGISNNSFNSSTSVTNWPDGRTGYGICCTRIDYNVANNRRRVVTIRFIINSASDDPLMAFVDFEFKVRIGDWHPMATVVSRPTTGHYNIGQLYWKYSGSSGVGSAWIGIETEYPDSIVTPVILGFDGETAGDHTTLDVKFGDFNSELSSGNWSITPVRKLAYFNMDLGKVGDTSTPVYVDTDGQVKPCNFQINFGTPIAGTNVLNIVT